MKSYKANSNDGITIGVQWSSGGKKGGGGVVTSKIPCIVGNGAADKFQETLDREGKANGMSGEAELLDINGLDHLDEVKSSDNLGTLLEMAYFSRSISNIIGDRHAPHAGEISAAIAEYFDAESTQGWLNCLLLVDDNYPASAIDQVIDAPGGCILILKFCGSSKTLPVMFSDDAFL